ncbi:MAG: hypothetical protein JXB20_02710 [Bacilli bacterium]|nr:hypothetical protein [Bacilli bacterium]MBN2696225.1 hypothetical protein [Bacilli bacterium]
MKTAVKVCKFLVILLGAFIILMAFDSFDGTDTFWGMLLEFFMNSLPGIGLILLIILLWKQELILGILMIAAGIGLFFLFKFYREFNEKWLTFLTVEVPLIGSGVLFLIYKRAQIRSK